MKVPLELLEHPAERNTLAWAEGGLKTLAYFTDEGNIVSKGKVLLTYKKRKLGL